MTYTCEFCGKTSHEAPLYHDWPFEYLGDVMYCWDCYHKEVIKQGKEAFHLDLLRENSGSIDHHTLKDAISEALYETEDDMDKPIGVSAPIAGSYLPSVIVYNGNLYERVADLRFLSEIQTEELRQQGIEEAIDKLKWNADIPLSIDTGNS